MEQWAEYLKDKGFDPENQLCTDDFAGHLAHNVNLCAKAICGLGAFGKLCEMRGDHAKAAGIFQGGTRVRAALGEGSRRRRPLSGWRSTGPDTWSQKYNLVWDRILGLNLFPAEVMKQEMAFYRKTQNDYGLPLDNRKTYTKLDWILWTATLTRDRHDFEALVDPVYLFLNETPDRSPMTDWYQTKTARKVGFTGRPVVGGVFAQMLYDKNVWKKYASRDLTKGSNWAPMPVYSTNTTTILVPGAREEAGIKWHYTTQKPADGWYQPDFDANAWQVGVAGFGTSGTPGAVVRTDWNTPDIWLRREFILPDGFSGNPVLSAHHDEDMEVYINGVEAATASGYTTDYVQIPLNEAGRAALKPGKNVMAVHCHQTTGGQYIDVGLINPPN